MRDRPGVEGAGCSFRIPDRDFETAPHHFSKRRGPDGVAATWRLLAGHGPCLEADTVADALEHDVFMHGQGRRHLELCVENGDLAVTVDECDVARRSDRLALTRVLWEIRD